MWEWEDENGKWNPYNAKTCLDLMTAQKEEETWVASKAAGRSYTIHIDRMEQVNTATNVKRAVRLQKTGELFVVVDTTSFFASLLTNLLCNLLWVLI